MQQNILSIQCDEIEAKTVREALSKSADDGFHVEWVRTCTQALKRLAKVGKQAPREAGGIAAVLVDLLLPDATGIETVDRVLSATPPIPIVILSSSQDAGIAKTAIQRGAQNFLLKEPLDDYVLPKTLTAVIDRADIAEALFDEKERAQVTLNSIGDAVVCTDCSGRGRTIKRFDTISVCDQLSHRGMAASTVVMCRHTCATPPYRPQAC